VSVTEGNFIGTFQIQNMTTSKNILSGSHRYYSLQWDVKKKTLPLTGRRLFSDFSFQFSYLATKQSASLHH
jgi:hypothetical protein